MSERRDNQIFTVPLRQARAFLQRMTALSDHASYEAFRKKYPKEYGALDYSRYGMDYRYHDDGN